MPHPQNLPTEEKPLFKAKGEKRKKPECVKRKPNKKASKND